MKKCSICKKSVPTTANYFPEYYNTLLNIDKFREDKNKTRFFNLIIKNLETNNKVELCECFENLEEITKLFNIYLDKNKNIKEQKDLNELIDNYKFNIVKNKLEETDFILFLKSEKKYFTCNLKNSKFIDYNELKSVLKSQNETKNVLKKQDVFLIYNFKPENTKQEFYYYDEVIIEILKYRLINNLTTYIFYNEIKRTDTFDKLITNINDEDIRKFYTNNFIIDDETSLNKSKKTNKPFEIK
jgi:hypothetical protein